MPLRSAFLPLLADPSPESWREIVKTLDDAMDCGDFAQVDADAVGLLRELRMWPAEIERPLPKRWAQVPGESGRALCKLARAVRETDLYPLYVEAAAKAPELRLHDGTPAVRLQRAFTGALQGPGGKGFRLGTVGQGDLIGSLCVEWPCYADADQHECSWCRLSVPLEVEVKRDAGKMRPEQEQRRDALWRRGEIYITVTRVAQMVKLLAAERDRILEMLRCSC